MYKVFSLCLLSLLSLSPLHQVNPKKSKQALEQLQKGRLEKAEKILRKTLAKNTPNPSAKYVYSLLYVHEAFARFHLDSAYRYAQEAVAEWSLLDEKARKKSIKTGFHHNLFLQQKSKIEQLAFAYAKAQKTLPAWTHFLHTYRHTPLHTKAISLRDSLAFTQAQEKNTPKAYLAFMNTYPKAKQMPLAQQHYETLNLQYTLGEKTLSTFESFLHTFPDSPKRSLVERYVLELMTLSHQPEEYLAFLEKYPNSLWKKRALDMLISTHPVYFKKHLKSSYLASFPHLRDSLSQAMDTARFLIPVLEHQTFGFLHVQDGTWALKPVYSNVQDSYKCMSTQNTAFVVKNKEKKQLINLKGHVLAKDIAEAHSLGTDLFKVKIGDAYGLWHSAGHALIPPLYEDIERLGPLLLVQQNGFVGLSSILGHEIVAPRYDDITHEGAFWVFEKDDALHIAQDQALYNIRDGHPFQYSHTFTDIEVEDEYLIGCKDGPCMLLNKDLDTLLPMQRQEILPMTGYWSVKKADGYYLFDAYTKTFSSRFHELDFSAAWAIAKEEHWKLIPLFASDSLQQGYDSAYLVGHELAVGVTGQKHTVHFKKYPPLALEGINGVRALYAPNNITDVYYAWEKDDQKYVLDKRLLVQGRYNTIEPLGEGFFLVEKDQKKGIIDAKGTLHVPILHTVIAPPDTTHTLALFRKGRFGAFLSDKNVYIPARYEEKLLRFGKDILKAKKKGRTGLIRANEKILLPFQYEDIMAWTHAQYWVKQKGLWYLKTLSTDHTSHTPQKKETRYISLEERYHTHQRKILRVQGPDGFGILDSQYGWILQARYKTIENLGTPEKPLYRAMRRAEDADLYIVLYTSSTGQRLFSAAYKHEDYARIYCESP